MKDEKEEDRSQRIALFRYGLIADLTDREVGQRGLYVKLREKAGKSYPIPYSRRTRVAEETLRDWLVAWRRGGFEALRPKPRGDLGQTRGIPGPVADLLVSIKDEKHSLSVVQVIERARATGAVPEDLALPNSTVHRLLSRARIGEAVRLRICDVDLDANTIRVGNTKFFKSRWVPFPEGLGDKLRAYLEARRSVGAVGAESPFFINHRRRPWSTGRVSAIFHGLVTAAQISLVPGTRRPRLHDVRHTFAVTRVLQWYREGTDVQAKLPLLATYLGHGSVLSTQVYLTATAELLHEASQRFEHAYGAVLAVSGGAR